ncbi:MAG: 1-phosphofructokinase family hexose kinase [Acidimicrobiales bacterium]
MEPGPEWSETDLAAVRQAYEAALEHCDLIAISGSLPCAAAEPVVAWMIRTARARGRHVALDSNGAGLRVGLPAAPWLVKPNREELAKVLGEDLSGTAAAWEAVRHIAAGVEVVLLSAGPGPLLASWQGAEWEAMPPVRTAVNALGGGDSLVAGVLDAVQRGWPPAEAIRWGTACGAANAVVWDPGRILRDDVERLLPEVTLRRVTPAHSPSPAATPVPRAELFEPFSQAGPPTMEGKR